jgi:hypothetical protein
MLVHLHVHNVLSTSYSLKAWRMRSIAWLTVCLLQLQSHHTLSRHNTGDYKAKSLIYTSRVWIHYTLSYLLSLGGSPVPLVSMRNYIETEAILSNVYNLLTTTNHSVSVASASNERTVPNR